MNDGTKHLYHGDYKNISALLMKQGMKQARSWVAHWEFAAPCRAPEKSAGTSLGRAHRWNCSARAVLQNLEWEGNLQEFNCLQYIAQERWGEGSDASLALGAGVPSSKICSQYKRKTFAALWLAVVSAIMIGLDFSCDSWCSHCTFVRKLSAFRQEPELLRAMAISRSSVKVEKQWWASWEQRGWFWLARGGPQWKHLHWLSMPTY